MISRLRLVAALVIAGAALAASPVLAVGAVAGYRGPTDKPQNREAPLNLPGKVAARPIPIVDAATLGRGIFDDDPAAALADLGTVTFGADGSVVETPASDILRGIFESAIRGHQTGK